MNTNEDEVDDGEVEESIVVVGTICVEDGRAGRCDEEDDSDPLSITGGCCTAAGVVVATVVVEAVVVVVVVD